MSGPLSHPTPVHSTPDSQCLLPAPRSPLWPTIHWPSIKRRRRLGPDTRHHLVSAETLRLQRGPGIHKPDSCLPPLLCLRSLSLCHVHPELGTTNCIMTCELNCKVSWRWWTFSTSFYDCRQKCTDSRNLYKTISVCLHLHSTFLNICPSGRSNLLRIKDT